jgi:hypothetical protein
MFCGEAERLLEGVHRVEEAVAEGDPELGSRALPLPLSTEPERLFSTILI